MTVRQFTGDGDRTWRLSAACRDVEPTRFFPTGDVRSSRADIDAAKAVCILCRVRRSCLDYAYRTDRHAGIWGGLTAAERRELAPRLAPRDEMDLTSG